jgi:hypothetical protein
MGETVILNLDEIKSSDFLHVKRYLCGSFGDELISTLTIKDEQGNTITEVVKTSSSGGMNISVALNTFLDFTKELQGKRYVVSYIIKSGELNIDTHLLCILQIK